MATTLASVATAAISLTAMAPAEGALDPAYAPHPHVAPLVAERNAATATGDLHRRGTLGLPARQRAALYGLSGREVMILLPGENDIGEIAPGVYFVVGGAAADTRRVVIQR